MSTRQVVVVLVALSAISVALHAQNPTDPPRPAAQGQGAGARMQPQLIDEIVPEYPAALLASGVSGVVVVDLILDDHGNVKDAHIFGRPTSFDEAVIATVKQWKFRLSLVNGVPFTPMIRRTFTFTADTKKVTITDPNAPAPPYRVSGDVHSPRLKKRVEPTYPPEGLAARTGGMVILEAVIDTQGKVKDLTVVRHLTPAFDRAAMTAVQQWEYEPVLLNGVPIEVIFTVTVNFSIR
jgi:TonB family protein